MSGGSNCVNCGAPISQPYCEYCGSPTYTAADALAGARGKSVHCWYEDGGVKMCFDISVSSIEVERTYETYFADNAPYFSVPGETAVRIESLMLDFDREAWAEHFGQWGR